MNKSLKNISSPYCNTFILSRYGTIIYLGCILLYNIHISYIDSRTRLLEFRNRKSYHGLSSEVDNIRNEWQAVKFGATENLYMNLYTSIIWPFTLIGNIIPYIVFKIN